MSSPFPNPALKGKERDALCWILSQPKLWFKDTTIEERDKALLAADPVSFVDYKKGSFLRKIVSFVSRGVRPCANLTVPYEDQQ